jgi:ABC-type amino acid transport substrate-binding protein
MRIRDRGKIRIGFDSDRMPFCYFRAGDPPKLVGFDVEMAYHLADDLQVDIEFVPIDPDTLNEQLQNDHFDIAMSAMEGTVKQAALLPAVEPYMSTTLAIVVPDHQKSSFRSREEILEIEDLKLAVIKGGYFAERAPKVLPETVQIVELQSASEFFEHETEDIHGLVTSAESGSAWTLRRPKFTVANPLQGRIRVPLYYLTASDPEFETFLQNWLTLQRADGTYDELYEYWILGLDPQLQRRRWCILRDVLGWVD